jgi:hypothetical protein
LYLRMCSLLIKTRAISNQVWAEVLLGLEAKTTKTRRYILSICLLLRVTAD